MITKLILFISLFMLSIGGFSQTVEKDSIQVLSIEKFEKMMSKKKNRLVDVRTPEEVSEGQIAGALNINFLGENFASEIQNLNKNETYLLYCRSGARTRKAADQMQKAGFKKVYMLEGGITAWKEAGNPIEQ